MLISGSVMLLYAGPPSQLWNCCKLQPKGANQSFLGEIDVWIRIDDSPIFGSCR